MRVEFAFWKLQKRQKKQTPHDSVQMFYKKIELLKEFILLEKPATKH